MTPTPESPALAAATGAAADPAVTGRIVTVSVGRAAPLEVKDGRQFLSGIRKRPVIGPVRVRPLGLEGDEQADLSVHGGLGKAIYAYPIEHLPLWRGERRARRVAPGDELLPPGFMGENLLLAGLLERQLWVGDTLHFSGSSCVLRITGPREPCYKFNTVMGFAEAAQLMVREAVCGFYLAVDEPGALAAGMAIRVTPGQRGLSLVEAVRAKWAKHRNG